MTRAKLQELTPEQHIKLTKERERKELNKIF